MRKTTDWHTAGFEFDAGTAAGATPETAEEVRTPARDTSPYRRLVNGKHDRAARRQEPGTPAPPALAVFCHEPPDSSVGRFLEQTAAALARRQTPVHLFTRHPFAAAPGVTVHAVGDSSAADLLGQVEEFTGRACKAFLEAFPTGTEKVTLLGHEWSSVPALALLREHRHLDALLALDSLERQRSDLSQDVSRRIEEIELSGLHEARALLFHQAATAEVAKYWVPDCAHRVTLVRQPFPVQTFERPLDPGAVKARYQVGPVDPTVVYVGDMNERYGPDVLMKAMPALLKGNQQTRCIFVGAGDTYWPMRVFARYLLLEHAVRLPGHVADEAVCELIQAADVVVLPSREPTPWWPVLAAWAARRPVVATHEAAPGLLAHQEDSVLFYPSENSCVWGVERVLFDPEMGRTIAANGRRKLEERFGWNCVAEQVQQLMGVQAARS